MRFFPVMKMLPAGGTEVTGRRETKNAGEMKLRNLSKKGKRQTYKKRMGKIWKSRK
jgi:hypothetical protein